MNIRPATPADIACMIQLERQCPGASHWSHQQYRQLFPGDTSGAQRLILVIEQASPDSATGNSAPPLAGFLVARHIPPEWELENIAVDPALRRTGLGTKLLRALLAQARQTNGNSVLLEVRESNLAARGFYEKLGFGETHRRKAYYADPSEDAILYCLPVEPFSQ
jgi:[ribosomal protein S18]-alanine N-acetyltransferase